MVKTMCAKMLLRDELTDVEKAELANMTLHPGFQVLKRMMAEHCQNTTEAVIKLDPMVDGYERKLALLQITSRATNDFCSSVLRSISVLRNDSVEQQQEEAAMSALMTQIRDAQRAVATESA
jgi:hypothetical protein